MLPEPHGGKLTGILDLGVDKYTSKDFKGAFEISYETAVTIMDMKNGILSPMTGFHGSSEIDSILSDQRLENGLPWSIPLLLSLDDSSILGKKEGDTILLKHKGELIAELNISEIYPLEKDRISKGVFGTLCLSKILSPSFVPKIEESSNERSKGILHGRPFSSL